MKNIITLIISNAITYLFANYFSYNLSQNNNWKIYHYNHISYRKM